MNRKLIRKLTVVMIFFLLLFGARVSFGAATCVISTDEVDDFRIITFSWVSHTDGTVATGTCDETTDASLGNVTGVIVGVKFEPDASTAPTDAYDVVINNAGGADILHGVGANVTNDDALTGQWKTPKTTNSGSVFIYQENLDLVITNAGSGKIGKVKLTLY